MSHSEIEPSAADVELALKEYVAAVHAHYGRRLHSVVLFGSRARGDMRPDSDADVAVIIADGDWRFWREKTNLADLAYEALVERRLVIQPWPIALGAWLSPATHHNPDFVKAILRDARPLLEPAGAT